MTHGHTLTAQAWKYMKAALDLLFDDAVNGGTIFADPHSYEATLPLRLLERHNGLPKLTFKP